MLMANPSNPLGKCAYFNFCNTAEKATIAKNHPIPELNPNNFPDISDNKDKKTRKNRFKR